MFFLLLAKDLHLMIKSGVEGDNSMWLQRVLFNVQTRLLGKNRQAAASVRPTQSPTVRRQAKRAQVFENKLNELDNRMSKLQPEASLK